jgi:hypothetical protein
MEMKYYWGDGSVAHCSGVPALRSTMGWNKSRKKCYSRGSAMQTEVSHISTSGFLSIMDQEMLEQELGPSWHSWGQTRGT